MIARKDGLTILVECKRWSGGRIRLAALKQAVGRHRERTTFYQDVVDTGAVPVIVTLIEEEIRIFNGVPLVPVHRLNSFISELESWLNDCSFAEFEDQDFFLADDPEDPKEEPDDG